MVLPTAGYNEYYRNEMNIQNGVVRIKSILTTDATMGAARAYDITQLNSFPNANDAVILDREIKDNLEYWGKVQNEAQISLQIPRQSEERLAVKNEILLTANEQITRWTLAQNKVNDLKIQQTQTVKPPPPGPPPPTAYANKEISSIPLRILPLSSENPSLTVTDNTNKMAVKLSGQLETFKKKSNRSLARLGAFIMNSTADGTIAQLIINACNQVTKAKPVDKKIYALNLQKLMEQYSQSPKISPQLKKMCVEGAATIGKMYPKPIEQEPPKLGKN